MEDSCDDLLRRLARFREGAEGSLQLETLASQRMVGMGDFKSTFGTVGIRCS